MDQKYEPEIIQAAKQELPPGVPAYSMGAFLASGRTNPVTPATATAPPTQPSVSAGFTSLSDRARNLVTRATTGIADLLGPSYNAVKTGIVDADPFRFRTPSEKASGQDFLTGDKIVNRTVALERGLNDLERKSTVPKVPNFYEQRLAQQASQ